MNNPFIYIQTIDEFKQFKDNVAGCSIVGIDTEFDRTRTYWPDLCLLQVATPSTIFVIEPQAFDLPWLSNFMANNEIIKIFHSCRQDLEAFYALFGTIPQNVFDTQVAATLVGMADQISYADLCQNLLQVQLCKEFQWSNWTKRPLLPQQIDYAANDVRYLASLYQELTRQLQQTEHHQLMYRIMSAYEDMATYQKNARRYFMNKLYHPSMTLDHASILYQLVEWREQYCQTHNIMRRLVFEDKDLQKIIPTQLFADFLPEHAMREILHQVVKNAQNNQEIPLFLQIQNIGHPIKAIHTKIKSILEPLKIPIHYVITQDMMIDFLLQPSHETNPLFNSWRHTLLQPCWDRLLMIKSKFQAQQNQGKNSNENVS